jgi:hypothetical protein
MDYIVHKYCICVYSCLLLQLYYSYVAVWVCECKLRISKVCIGIFPSPDSIDCRILVLGWPYLLWWVFVEALIHVVKLFLGQAPGS